MAIKDPVRLKRWKERREYIISKKSVPCEDCGRTFPRVCMEFHHLDGSTKNPALRNRGFIDRMQTRSIKTIDEEIAKCAIICSNCHKIRHHGNGH